MAKPLQIKGEIMLYAIIAIIALLLIFIVVSYFIIKKTYTFRLNEKEVTLKSQGNSIKIFLEGSLISTTLYPNLFGGQDIEVKIDDTDYVFSCKSSSFGFKLRVEVYSGGNLITDNGVILKENAQKIDTKKGVIEDTHKDKQKEKSKSKKVEKDNKESNDNKENSDK